MTVLNVEGVEVSGGAAELLNLMSHLPLVSQQDLRRVLGFSKSYMYSRISELRDGGLVDSVPIGSTQPLTLRYFLTREGLSETGNFGSSWHDEPALCRLLERLPSLECFYRVVSEISDLGPFRSFHWLDGIVVDAIVRYEHGWIALFWSGMLQNEEWVVGRLNRLGADLNAMSVDSDPPWPSMLVFAASDQWQRELVYRAATRCYLDDELSVWCAADFSRSGVHRVRPSLGWVEQPLYHRDTGGWRFQDRVDSCCWGLKRGSVLSGVLEMVAQWPGLDAGMIRSHIGEGASGRTAYRMVSSLRELGLIATIRDGSRNRYRITARARDLLVRRDRVSFTRCRARIDSPSWVESPRLRLHEEGVMSFLSSFIAAGVPAAAGWRSWEHLGGSGGISPDGLVYLKDSPFGPTWAYFEYERSARGDNRVRRKMRGYGSSRRGNNWPVLMVAWDESVEPIFHSVGMELGVPMLTTTLDRLAVHGPLDNLECWSWYGARALLR